MKLYSTNKKAPLSNLKKAVLEGLPEDGGLFIPQKITKLPKNFFETIEKLTFQQIALAISKKLIGKELKDNELKKIIAESLNFDAPLIKISTNSGKENSIYSLELFHGPTLAFKDFGARFMARLISHFMKNSGRKITILVATSGDTGSAVASGFFKVKNIKVILLYPSKKVSKIQEQQLTTMGANITALEIEGTFDDCQKLVKQAFLDKELKKYFQKNNDSLGSANSINIARLIPQSFYYFYAYAQLKKLIGPNINPPIFSVPSGNLGNLTAGLIAKEMGLPVTRFIAATNSNNTFTKFLKTGKFKPKASIKTISNAMDVGNPSNFARIQELYKNNLNKIRKNIWSKSFSDKETKKAILEVLQKSNYIMDPHGAVAYLGIQAYLNSTKSINTSGIFLETAHPAKFLDIVESTIKKKVEIPSKLAACLDKEKKSIKLSKKFKEFKRFLSTQTK